MHSIRDLRGSAAASAAAFARQLARLLARALFGTIANRLALMCEAMVNSVESKALGLHGFVVLGLAAAILTVDSLSPVGAGQTMGMRTEQSATRGERLLRSCVWCVRFGIHSVCVRVFGAWGRGAGTLVDR